MRRRGSSVACIILAAAVGLGCAGADVAGERPVRVDSAGIELVTNPAVDRPLDWAFEPEVVLGGEADGPESFFQVPATGAAFDGDGKLYVLDGGNRRVAVFDPDGAHVRTIGGPGEGPGELQLPTAFAVSEPGDVRVFDARQRAVSRFDETGEFIERSPTPAGFLGGHVRSRDGAHIYETRRSDGETGRVYLRVTRATPVDTVDLATLRLPETQTVAYEECGILGMRLSPLFAERPAWDARDGRLAIALMPGYDVRVYDEDDEVMRVRRALEPEASTSGHAVEELGEGERWTVGRERTCTVEPDRVIEARGIADRVPLTRRVAVAPDGGIWVQRRVLGELHGPIDVFDATGEYVGTLPGSPPWPVDFGPEGRFVALERDELDVQRVVVYRLRREA